MPIKAYWSGGPADPLGTEPVNPGVSRYEEQQRVSGPQGQVMRKWDYDPSGMITPHFRRFDSTAAADAASSDWHVGATILVWDGASATTPEIHMYTGNSPSPWFQIK